MINCYSISVSTSRETTNEVKATFPTPKHLDADTSFYVGLKNYAIPYTWYNISEKFKNNRFKYFDPETKIFKEIKIDDGNHDCETLNFYLNIYFNKGVENLPIVFSEYPATNRICMTLEAGFKVDFTDFSLRFILGFGNKIYENEKAHKQDFVGEYVAKIEKDVRMLLIHCSLVTDSYIMDKSGKLLQKDVIYSFTPNKSPGSWMTESPNPRDYFLISKTTNNQIQEIFFSITDQDNNAIDFNGEKCTLTIDISKII